MSIFSIKSVKVTMGIVLALFLIIQLIPYETTTNPPVLQEPTWDSPATREMVKQTCFDCHSNETVWPWYSKVAPVSWLVYHDVKEGREELNFSEWDSGRDGEELEEIIEEIRKEKMPIPIYLIMHPEATLSKTQKEKLIAGFKASLTVDRATQENTELN